MARIRTIKPTIWGDARFAGLSRDARLLTLGLISAADDAGRFIASPTSIAGAVYPHDNLTPAQVKRWRDEIASAGLIQLYNVDGREYGWFPRWTRHQKINRPQRSSLPAPPGAASQPPPPSEPPPDDSLNGSLNAHGTNHDTLTGGREGIGREGNAAAAANARGAVNGAAAAIAELRTAAIADGLVVRWDKLTNEHRADLHQLVHRHGVAALVRAAQRVLRVDDPPRYANAWIPHWQALPAPGQRLRAVSGTCSEHSLALPCIGCAADAKAVGG